MHLFGISPDTFAQIAVTIGIFWLGLILQGIFRVVNAYFSRSSLRKFLKHALIRYLKGLHATCRNIEDLIPQIDIHHNGHFSYTPINNSAIESLEEITQKELYNAFFGGLFNKVFYLYNHSRRIAVNDLYAYKSLSIRIQEKLPATFTNFIIDLNKYNEMLNAAKGEVMEIFEDFRTKCDGEQVPVTVAEYFNELEIIYKIYRETENHLNPYITETQFIQPMLSLNRKVYRQVNAVIGPDLINNLNRACLLSSHRYSNWSHHVKVTKENLVANKLQLEKSQKALFKAIRILYRSFKDYYIEITQKS